MYLLIFNFLRFTSVPSKSEAYTKVYNLYPREKNRVEERNNRSCTRSLASLLLSLVTFYSSRRKISLRKGERVRGHVVCTKSGLKLG